MSLFNARLEIDQYEVHPPLCLPVLHDEAKTMSLVQAIDQDNECEALSYGGYSPLQVETDSHRLLALECSLRHMTLLMGLDSNMSCLARSTQMPLTPVAGERRTKQIAVKGNPQRVLGLLLATKGLNCGNQAANSFLVARAFA